MANPVEIFTIRLWREKMGEGGSGLRVQGGDPRNVRLRYFNEMGKVGEFISANLC